MHNLEVYTGHDQWQANTNKEFMSSRSNMHSSQSQQHGDQHFRRVPIDVDGRYREAQPDSANLLVKELALTDVNIYYDNSGEVLIPFDVIEMAQTMGDPRLVFEKVPVQKINQVMG